MFNHARTLLSNTPPVIITDPLSLEEPAPSDFLPVRLPKVLRIIRQALFGTTPDRLFINYRVYQFMTLLHHCPVSDHLRTYDDRITYSVGDNDALLTKEAFLPRVVKLSGTEEDLPVLGQPTIPDPTGQMVFSFNVDVLTTTTVEVKRVYPAAGSDIIEFELLADGRSQQIELPGSGYYCQLPSNDVSNEWLVDIHNRPQWSLGDVVANLEEFMTEEVAHGLFGIAHSEPMKTFRNLWRSDETPLRLAGVLLALIESTEVARTKANE